MARPTLKPRRLRAGDTVAVVTPSYPALAAWPHRLERGVAQLERLGFRVKLMPNAREAGAPGADYVAGSPLRRASDLNEAFADSEVRAIVTAIGGDHSCQLLPNLDWEAIAANPTIFMGFSDITVLNVALWARTGLVTFNGPHLISEIAEYPEMPEYSRESMLRTLTASEPPGELLASDWWTDELLDWNERLDLTRPRERRPAPGWTWLKGGGGILIGGCLESLQHLRGTPFWPSLDDWDGAVFFLETSEEKPTPADVDAILADYENMGVLARIAALLVGRPYGYTDEQRRDLHTVLLERTKGFDFPIVCDMDFGHTSPMLTLPIGCRARVDPSLNTVAVVEPAVS